HEMAHIAHRDVAVMTIASFLGICAGLITRFGLHFGLWGGFGRSRDQNTGLILLAVVAASALAYAISFLLTRALSRYRELSADRAAALLTGRPSALASALTKVTGEIARIPTQDLRSAQAFNAFFLTPAFGRCYSIANLFSTHPPLEKRLAQISKTSEHLSRGVGSVGFLDTLRGRSKPVKPDLDRLFALSTAALTLEAATGFTPTGLGSVRFRAAEGGAFARLQRDVQELLDADEGPKVEVSEDEYGYTWILAKHEPAALPDLVTDLHAVNATLEANGFGPHLLVSLVAFQDPGGRRLALVYLYKRGTFYPFA